MENGPEPEMRGNRQIWRGISIVLPSKTAGNVKCPAVFAHQFFSCFCPSNAYWLICYSTKPFLSNRAFRMVSAHGTTALSRCCGRPD
ncbi:hypothetical protein B4099_1897 [Heyndrickxia coagulans]|uniref:Uncharacterized protein n=1 Tax=Heyndrickxia coagulans TaxID=1398 RepID=A0A150JZX5_HEYCO|nr:hypothetical protein B4099_1897 [Heyndrickxia coagulans]